MVIGVPKDITYCSLGSFSSKQKIIRSASKPQVRSENTPATIEADLILLAFQQLANNTNSATFICNFHRISKLPKSLTWTMPTFDGKSQKLELFEGLFQTSLQIHNQLTTDDKINYFDFLKSKDALQTFENNNSLTRGNSGEFLTVSDRTYVKPLSMAKAKHNFQKFFFNLANQKLVEFPNELQKLAEEAFGIAADAVIQQFI